MIHKWFIIQCFQILIFITGADISAFLLVFSLVSHFVRVCCPAFSAAPPFCQHSAVYLALHCRDTTLPLYLSVGELDLWPLCHTHGLLGYGETDKMSWHKICISVPELWCFPCISQNYILWLPWLSAHQNPLLVSYWNFWSFFLFGLFLFGSISVWFWGYGRVWFPLAMQLMKREICSCCHMTTVLTFHHTIWVWPIFFYC